MPTFTEVTDVIREERTYQHEKWGGPSNGNTTSIASYISYMEVYLGEIKSLQAHNAKESVLIQSLDGLRKVTALGVAAMEEHGVTHREVV